jgi:hypothetical protein
MAKLVHVGRHYAAVAFLEKGSPVTSISKGGPGGFAVPKHGSIRHAEHDKVGRIRRDGNEKRTKLSPTTFLSRYV